MDKAQKPSNPDHSSTLKKEAAGCSETLVLIYQTTLHHIPEDTNLHQKHIVTDHQI
jgi:hypothetical protein